MDGGAKRPAAPDGPTGPQKDPSRRSAPRREQSQLVTRGRRPKTSKRGPTPARPDAAGAEHASKQRNNRGPVSRAAQATAERQKRSREATTMSRATNIESGAASAIVPTAAPLPLRDAFHSDVV